MQIQQPSLLYQSPLSSTKHSLTPSTKSAYSGSTRMNQPQNLPQIQQFGIDNDIYHITKMMKTTSCDEKENQKHKTDRFIPIRKTLSMEINNMDMQYPNQNQNSMRGKQVNDKKITLDQMYKTLLLEKQTSKLFSFNSAQSILQQSNIINSYQPHSFLNNTSLPYQRLQSKQPCNRKISATPFKVLDAPNLQDDFYLNLLQWSSQNILSVALDTNLYMWNATNNKVIRFCQLQNNMITSLGWNDQGTHIAMGTNKGTTQVWDANKGVKVYQVAGHQERVSSLAWRGNQMATGSRDRTIRVRDVRQCQTNVVAKYQGHTQEVCGLKWSFDGNYLASGGNDNKLMIWSKSSTTPISKFSQHCAAVKGLAWSPHNHGVLASGGGTADRTIKFWNTLNGTMLDSIDTGSQVCNLMFSKTTKQLVSTHGYSNNEIIIWKYPSLEKVGILTGHTSRVLFLAMNPSGQTIVTGAGDETLRFWNVFPQTKNHQSGTKKGNCLSTLQLR